MFFTFRRELTYSKVANITKVYLHAVVIV